MKTHIRYRDYIVWPVYLDGEWWCEITDSACGDVCVTESFAAQREAVEAAKAVIDAFIEARQERER